MQAVHKWDGGELDTGFGADVQLGVIVICVVAKVESIVIDNLVKQEHLDEDKGSKPQGSGLGLALG